MTIGLLAEPAIYCLFFRFFNSRIWLKLQEKAVLLTRHYQTNRMKEVKQLRKWEEKTGAYTVNY